MRSIFEKWVSELKIPGKPDEFEVKRLLKDSGVGIPDGVIVEPGEKINAGTFTGLHVAKVCSPEILHKTDLGGVVLNLKPEDVLEAVERLRSKFPGQRILIEEQSNFLSSEFIIGAIVDPVFGASIMVGAGGILTEIYRDVSFRLAPCSLEEASRMLDELILSPIFEGYRGIGIDKKELAGIVSKVSRLISQMGERFSQMDINPIVYTGEKWIALDAKLILKDT